MKAAAEKITYLPEIHRLLPQAADAERGLISSFLQDAMFTGGICAEKNIRSVHFHIPAHAILYNRLLEMWVANDPVDLITVTQRLRDKNELDMAGGVGLITEISTFLPTARNAEFYADTLQEKLTLRDLIKTCTEYASRAYDEQDDPFTLLGEATAKICSIASVTTTAKPLTPKEIVLQAADRVEGRHQKRGLPDNVMRTGIKGIDDAMGGIRPADYVLISGKEKSGKTSLAFNIFEHIVFEQKKRALVVSLEMKIPEIADRLFAARGRINLTNILNGWITDEETTSFGRISPQIAEGKFQWRDDLCSLGQIVAAFRQYKSQFPDLEFAIVDYLQLIDAEKQRKDELREQAIAAISRTMRRLGMELNVAILMLVQLNEDGQVRESRSPGMDCTAHIRIEPGDEDGKKFARIVYQRNGPSNVGIPLTHIGQFLRFEASAHAHEEPPTAKPKKRNWHQ